MCSNVEPTTQPCVHTCVDVFVEIRVEMCAWTCYLDDRPTCNCYAALANVERRDLAHVRQPNSEDVRLTWLEWMLLIRLCQEYRSAVRQRATDVNTGMDSMAFPRTVMPESGVCTCSDLDLVLCCRPNPDIHPGLFLMSLCSCERDDAWLHTVRSIGARHAVRAVHIVIEILGKRRP